MPKYAENTPIWLQPVLSSRDFYKIVIEVNPKRFQTVAKGDQIQSYYDRKEKIIVYFLQPFTNRWDMRIL